MSDVSASNSSSMSLRAPRRTSVLVRSSASVPCLAPIANCSANCPSCSAGGIRVIGLGLLGVSLSGFSPTTDGSPDHSLFTDRLSHHLRSSMELLQRLRQRYLQFLQVVVDVLTDEVSYRDFEDRLRQELDAL